MEGKYGEINHPNGLPKPILFIFQQIPVVPLGSNFYGFPVNFHHSISRWMALASPPNCPEISGGKGRPFFFIGNKSYLWRLIPFSPPRIIRLRPEHGIIGPVGSIRRRFIRSQPKRFLLWGELEPVCAKLDVFLAMFWLMIKSRCLRAVYFMSLLHFPGEVLNALLPGGVIFSEPGGSECVVRGGFVIPAPLNDEWQLTIAIYLICEFLVVVVYDPVGTRSNGHTESPTLTQALNEMMKLILSRLSVRRKQSVLIIRNPSEVDVGVYRCQVQNSFGSSSDLIRIVRITNPAKNLGKVIITRSQNPPRSLPIQLFRMRWLIDSSGLGTTASTLWPIQSTTCPYDTYCLNGGTCR